MPPIDPEYRPYFLTQRIEELRKLAISSKTTDMLRTMQELMGAIDCWYFEECGLAETAEKLCAFVQRNYKYHNIGHLPPESVRHVLTEWFVSDRSIPLQLGEPVWNADERYLLGWLIVFALHEDCTPVDAWVEFNQYREEFLIHGVRRI